MLRISGLAAHAALRKGEYRHKKDTKDEIL